MLRLTKSEYDDLAKKNRDTRSSALHTNNSQNGEIETYQQAIQALRDIQGACESMLFTGPVAIRVEIDGCKRSDLDNIFKGVADGLQGVCYENDKQVRQGLFTHNDSRDFLSLIKDL